MALPFADGTRLYAADLNLLAPKDTPTFTGLTTTSQSLAVTGSQTITALATPTAPTGTPSAIGGTIAASVTNYCTRVALDSTGSVVGTESAAVTTTGTTSSIAWAGAAVSGATSFQFWCSLTQGVYAKYFTSSSPSFTQTAPASTGTAGTIPTVNSTGQAVIGSGATGFRIRPTLDGGGSAFFTTAVTPGAGNFSMYADANLTVLNGVTGARLYVNGSPIIVATATGASVTGTLSSTGTLKVGAGGISISPTLPTIASGFGTTPSAVTGANTGGFTLTIGTGGTDVSGVLTFPAATTRWSVTGVDNTSYSTIRLVCVGTSATSVTVYAYSETTGLAVAFTAGDVLTFSAIGL